MKTEVWKLEGQRKQKGKAGIVVEEVFQGRKPANEPSGTGHNATLTVMASLASRQGQARRNDPLNQDSVGCQSER